MTFNFLHASRQFFFPEMFFFFTFLAQILHMLISLYFIHNSVLQLDIAMDFN